MKILYPVPEYIPGKKARFIQIINTCHALSNADSKVSLFTGIKSGRKKKDILKYYGLEQADNLKIIKLPVLRGKLSWNFPFYFFFLIHTIREKNAIIFVRHLKLAYFLIKYRWIHNHPVLYEAHEIFHKTTEKSKRSNTLKNMENLVFHKANFLIAISNTLKEEIKRLFNRKDISVIHDGVNKDFIDHNQKNKGTKILYLGQLYPWKGVDVLIRAMKYLKGEKLMIVGGDNSQINKLSRIAKEEGVINQVEFTATVPHAMIKDFLKDACVAVIPNRYEGVSQYTSPLKLFEYMASGIPVVATNIPSVKEILNDGDNAILVQPENPESLAKGIKCMMKDNDLSHKIAKKAKEDVAKYTWDNRAKIIIDILKAKP